MCVEHLVRASHVQAVRSRRGPLILGMRSLLVVLSASFGLLLQALPAWAVPAGGNGDFVFVQKSLERAGEDGDIIRMGVDGDHPVNLTDGGIWQNQPNWSPDGRHIVYTSSSSLWVMKRNGSGSKVLLYPRSAWYPTSPAWSPDGTEIAYSRHYWDSDVNVTRAAIYILDLATGKSDYVAPTGIKNNEIDWSPDGKRLVFQHWRYIAEGATYGSHVMVVDRDGTDLTDLTVVTNGTNNDWRPSWTHDGRIVFRRYTGTCTAIICTAGFYSVQPDGSDPELLPLPPRDWTGDGQNDTTDRLRQSPDGSAWALLVYDASTTTHQLWRLDSTFSDPKKLYEPVFWYVDWQPRCTVRGTSRSDTLVGTPKADLICGLGGDDVIKGLGGNDVIFGHGGNDRIAGGAGRDIVVGNAGRDQCDRDEEDYSNVC